MKNLKAKLKKSAEKNYMKKLLFWKFSNQTMREMQDSYNKRLNILIHGTKKDEKLAWET